MISKLALALCCVTTLAGSAHADDDWKHDRAFFEWSTWFGLSLASKTTESTTIQRAIHPADRERSTEWGIQAAFGADLTLPIPAPHMRLGPWVELRGSELFNGAELQFVQMPSKLDMFLYDGEGVVTMRAGASESHLTGAFAFGYRCPWKLWGPYSKSTRYMIGVRVVASATRAFADPHDWSFAVGLETEPVGALRYLLGIRSWY